MIDNSGFGKRSSMAEYKQYDPEIVYEHSMCIVWTIVCVRCVSVSWETVV